MLADKTGVEGGQAGLVESSFCQKATQQPGKRRNRGAERLMYFFI